MFGGGSIKPGKEKATIVYQFIIDYFLENQSMPTIRDIMRGLGYTSPSPIQMQLDRLKKEGFIDWGFNQPRSFRLLKFEVQLKPIKRKYGKQKEAA